MITHKIKLYGYTAELVGESQLVLGTVDSYGIEHIELEIGGIWSGLVLFATFHYSGTATKMAVDSNGIVEVPPQATQSGNSASTRGKIVFHAVSETQQAISTDIEYRVYQHSDVDGNEPLPPDTSWNQIIAQAGAARDEAVHAASEAKKSLEEIGDSVERAEAAANRAEQVAGDVTSAGSAEIEKIKQAGTDEVNRVKSEGDVQVQRISEEGNAASGYAEQAKKYAEEAAGYVSDVSDATNQAVSDINASKQTAITQIGSAGSEQISNVQSAGNAVVETIESEKNVAVQAVKDAQTTGVNAVQAAQTEGVKAVNDAGNAKVEEIEQINALLPKPTEADAGKVPVAQPDGSYQLGDAGNKIDDSAIAEDTTWSSKETASRIYQMREVSGAIVCIDDALPEFPMKVTAEAEVTRCGKNLLDISGMRTTQKNGLTFELKDGGIHITGTATSITDSPIFYFALPAGTYIGNITRRKYPFVNSVSYVVKKTDGSLFYENAQMAFTVEPDEEGQYFYFALDANVKIDATIYPQLEVGAEATNYEPYTGETFPAGEPIMPLDGVNTIFAASGGVAVGYASKVKAPINDAQITPLNTWSAQKLVDTLCPPFSVTGDVVQFAPIEGYPLSVQSTIVATQSGDGDPSPMNVRPITPVEQVGAWVGGKNFLDLSQCELFPVQNRFGLSIEKISGGVRVYGTSSETLEYASFAVLTSSQEEIRGKNFVFSWFSSQTLRSVYGLRTPTEKSIAIQLDLVEGQSYDFTVQIALSTEKLTAYEPYRGKLYTAPLDAPCYGGTVDLTGGTGEAEWAVFTLNSQNCANWVFGTVGNQTTPVLQGRLVNAKIPVGTAYCTHFTSDDTIPVDDLKFLSISNYFGDGIVAVRNDVWDSKESALAWLDAQESAGTPVQILYQLAAPTPFTFAPLSIHAPASPATAYSTAGEVTVAGRSDPLATIQQMQEQIASIQTLLIGG